MATKSKPPMHKMPNGMPMKGKMPMAAFTGAATPFGAKSPAKKTPPKGRRVSR